MKLDRLIGILTILVQEKKITAPELAKRFEVSRRTISRDIDSLDMAGIPIVTTRGEGGGISLMDGFKIDESKLMGDKNISIDLFSFYKDSLTSKIEIIKKAIAESRAISFDYYYPKGEVQRLIDPYSIEFRMSAWYVFGWCRERKDFRRFKLNRLWGLTATEERFNKRPVPDEKTENIFYDHSFIKIRFDKSVRFRLIEDYGLNSYEEREDGLVMNATYTNADYIISWILSFGDKAEVISPPEIRAAFSEIVKKIFEKYK